MKTQPEQQPAGLEQLAREAAQEWFLRSRNWTGVDINNYQETTLTKIISAFGQKVQELTRKDGEESITVRNLSAVAAPAVQWTAVKERTSAGWYVCVDQPVIEWPFTEREAKSIVKAHNAALAAERKKYVEQREDWIREIQQLSAQLDKNKARMSERKSVHQWLTDQNIPEEENGKRICLLRRLRITLDRLAEQENEADGLRDANRRLFIESNKRFQQLATAQAAIATHNALNKYTQISYTDTDCLDAYVREQIKDFATKILHGDDVHKQWLTEAAEAYCDGHSLPAPRSKPITDDDVNEAWDELMSELDVGFITDGKTYECGQCGGKGKSKSEVKHEDGCIHPAIDKVSRLNRKAAATVREQMQPLLQGLHRLYALRDPTCQRQAEIAYETALGNVKEK